MISRDYLKGKRVAIVGLGPHGELVEDVSFFIKAGALVSIYDLKSEARLKQHLVFLRTQGLANYVCGSIPADDLLDMDLIILSHEYPRESRFLKFVKEKGIPIEYPETFFFKQAPPVTVVGVMGECGKATVVSMLAPMLAAVCKAGEKQGFFVIDPDTDEGIISRLKKIKSGDVVLVRIIEPMMRELTAIRISPHVAVFTTVPGRGSFDESPFEILSYQTYNNFIVASDEVIDSAGRHKDLPRAKMLRTKTSIIPEDWDLQNIAGKSGRIHDRDNAALALQTARLFKVDDETARRFLESWKPLRGRLELVKKVKQVEFYNDTASTNPASTLVALQTIVDEKSAILIFGGAQTASDYRKLYSALPKYVHTLILLPGSGTLRERPLINGLEEINIYSVPSIEEATRLAFEQAKKGDKVLFSPGFEVAGLDNSRKERGERFVKSVRSL